MKIQIQGIDEVVRDFELIGEKGEAFAKKVIQQAGADCQKRAKQFCPVDTGNLKRSIVWGLADPFTALVVAGMEYAAYVEFGTRNMRPQPYMEYGFLWAENNLEERLKEFKNEV